MDFHPGGREVIRAYAGRDATTAFREAHTNWEQCLQDVENLRVGHLVPRRPAHLIRASEVALHGFVYDIERKFLLLNERVPPRS